mgnify:CR=1 FL=1
MKKFVKTIKVDTLVGGRIIPVNPSEIGKKMWTRHSGMAADGTQVNSLHTHVIGESTLVRDNNGKVSSYLTNELQVLGQQIQPK